MIKKLNLSIVKKEVKNAITALKHKHFLIKNYKPMPQDVYYYLRKNSDWVISLDKIKAVMVGMK